MADTVIELAPLALATMKRFVNDHVFRLSLPRDLGENSPR